MSTLLSRWRTGTNAERLYEEAFLVLETCNYDVVLAGAALLGYDANLIVEETTRQALFNVLGDPVKRDRLVIHMDRSIASDATIRTHFIEQFERGLGLAVL